MKTLTPAAVNRALDKINAKPNPMDKTRWYVFSADGKLIASDLRYKTARGALMRAIPGAHIYSQGVSGGGTVSYAIDKEPRHVFVTNDPDFDLRMKKSRSANPARKTRAVRVVAANPVKRPKSLYVVWTAAADGIKHERLATFEKLSEARKYAQAYADSSGKKMIVETKAL